MTTLTEVDRFILAARLKGYLSSNHGALAILSEGLKAYPDDVRMLQLRGIKRLIARDIAGALEDLERAAGGLAGVPDEHEFYRGAVEQDVVNLVLGREDRLGAQHPPLDESSASATRHLAKGTLHASTWQHLGLARYLHRRFDAAADAFELARDAAVEEHQAVAALDWQYMSLRRAGRPDAAGAVLAALDEIDYDPEALDSPNVPNSLKGCYVQRLRMYRGELQPQDLLRQDTTSGLAVATLGYGVANWYLYEGHLAAARRAFARVLELGDPTTVGYLAAEHETENYDIRRSIRIA